MTNHGLDPDGRRFQGIADWVRHFGLSELVLTEGVGWWESGKVQVEQRFWSTLGGEGSTTVPVPRFETQGKPESVPGQLLVRVLSEFSRIP